MAAGTMTTTIFSMPCWTSCTLLIAGGAKGADTLRCQWAQDREVRTAIYEAQWAKYGPEAGPVRNERMLREGKPGLVVAFAGGRGAADMVSRARAAGVEVLALAAATKPSKRKKQDDESAN